MFIDSFDRLKKVYLKSMIRYLIVMAIVWIGVLIYAKFFMSTGQMVHHFSSGIAKDPTSSTNFLPLFFWNLGGAGMVILLGIIPLPIYWYYILTNAVSVGMVISIIGNPILMFLGGVLPHGIFEISAQLVAAAISARIAWYGMNRLFRRKKQEVKYFDLLKQSLIDYLVLVLPLMLMAGIVETYITPVFLKMVMPH
ncbi:stage II sporulation protein M [Lentilactobacillus otakiensis]|nr:stage II sporulation protein M [Lentilactobacillus otakiensis]MBZ3776977.1 stage II sporulation protein M [Lentilactobacillus otakiensis]MDV3517578.1 stage II sporulation protein M [Lentilactobacillus otakiensis]